MTCPKFLNLPLDRPISATESRIRVNRVRRDGVAMSNDQADADKLLTPAEVAAMFRVNAKTVTRWARSGRLSAIKTMGGHRRYRLSEVRRAVEAIGTDA
jgi:excisionase family DNA binding protein